MSRTTTRVLVVEDSPTARALLVAILNGDPDIQVIGQAKDGAEAVELAERLRPHAITMDLHMPGMDGLEAIAQIMSRTPTPIVVVSSSVEAPEVASAMHALRAGAVMALPKPSGPDASDFAERSRELTLAVKAMAEVKLVRRWAARAQPRAAARNARSGVGVIAVGASTGGPAALHRILGELPRDVSVPILVVQHIAVGFLPGLVDWLNAASALPVKIAQGGERAEPGTVYIAPDSGHLGLSGRDTLLVSESAPIGGHRPSATFLFESAARAHGARCVALILTGMGRDGVDGLRAVHAAGGHVIAQDEESSVVFGMPAAAIQEGFVEDVLPLGGMAAHLARLLEDARKLEKAAR